MEVCQMAYVVVNGFRDKEDKEREYKTGDVYPQGDHKPSKKRLEELSKEHPEHKRVFIEKVKEDKETKEPSPEK